MGKGASFQAKIAKGSASRGGKVCPECGQSINTVKFVYSEKSPVKDSWKFNQRFLDICKCNENDAFKA